MLWNRRKRKPKQDPVAQTANHQPNPHNWWHYRRKLPPFTWEVVEEMKLDGQVSLSLAMRAAPVASLQWAYEDGAGDNGEPKYTQGIKASSAAVAEFVEHQLKLVWLHHFDALAMSQEHGWSAGEVVLGEEHGLRVINRLEPRHPRYTKALKVDGTLAGVRITNLKAGNGSDSGHADLLFPESYFVTHKPQPGKLYGTSTLVGGYSPWHDKTSEGGACDVRRLFMHKDAYGGRTVGYPEKTVQVGTGNPVPARDIANEIVEKLQTGGVACYPTTLSNTGQPEWVINEATVAANPQHISQYPKDLDAEIRRGIGIPDDVIDSDGAGGWAGKRIPMAAFCNSLDSWARCIYGALGKQVIQHLVLVNFGPDAWFEINHKPLAMQAMEQQGDAGGGAAAPAAQPFVLPERMSLIDEVAQGTAEVGRVMDAARVLAGENGKPSPEDNGRARCC